MNLNPAHINEPVQKRVPLGNQGIRAGYLQSMLSVYHPERYARRSLPGSDSQSVESLSQIPERMQNIDLDLPDSPQHLHQLHPQGKECAGNRRTDPRSRLDDRRERRTDGNAATTVPDDQSIGTTGQIDRTALPGRKKLRGNSRNHRTDCDQCSH